MLRPNLPTPEAHADRRWTSDPRASKRLPHDSAYHSVVIQELGDLCGDWNPTDHGQSNPLLPLLPPSDRALNRRTVSGDLVRIDLFRDLLWLVRGHPGRGAFLRYAPDGHEDNSRHLILLGSVE